MPQGVTPPEAKLAPESITTIIIPPVEHLFREDPTQFKWKHVTIVVAAALGVLAAIVVLVSHLLPDRGGMAAPHPNPIDPRTINAQDNSRPIPIQKDVQTTHMAKIDRQPKKVKTTDEKKDFIKSLSPSEYPVCSICGKKMVPRTNRTTDEPFWGCRDFPTCRGSRIVE